MLSLHPACKIPFKRPGISFIQIHSGGFPKGHFADSRDVLQMGPASRTSTGSMQKERSLGVELTKKKSHY